MIHFNLALIVRFLTKKYLPEYSNGTREIYNRDIIVDGKIVHTKITDTLGTVSQFLIKFM